MVTPSQLTVLITAIGYPCRTYTMSNTHRNPQLFNGIIFFDKVKMYILKDITNLPAYRVTLLFFEVKTPKACQFNPRNNSIISPKSLIDIKVFVNKIIE